MELTQLLIKAMLPILLKQAEKLLAVDSNSIKDHSWIIGLVDDIAKLLDSKLPGFLKPSEDEIKLLVEEAIGKIIGKL